MSLPVLDVASSTASGAASGMALGSIVPGLGTLAGGIVGGAIGLISGIFGASAEEEAEKEARRQALRNKAILDQAARDATARGEAAIGRHHLEVGQLQGRQRAALGSSGVVGNQGSALDIQTSTAGMAELDELTIRANAAREAWGYKMQGKQIMAQLNANEKAADAQDFSEFISAGTNLAGSLYKNRYDLGLAERPKSGATGG